MRPVRIQTVLLIEDNKAIRDIYAEALEDFGYNVLQAANVKRGLDLWRRYSPDLVVTDWCLPDSKHTGEAFLKEWMHAPGRCPVLVCSGTPEYAKYAHEVYGVQYLIKPVDLDVLEHAIERLLAVEEVA